MTTVTGEQGSPPADATIDESGTAPEDRRFRPDVEGLRAVAVIVVLLYHANMPGLSGGFIGVDVFFVISGFVITGLLLRERATTDRTSLRSFYGRRVRRILPAATLVIVVTVVATYTILGVIYGNPTAVAARWTAVFLANFHFANIGTDYLSATLPPSPLQNFWSLAVEEQFYLAYPAIFLVAASIRSKSSLRARLVFVLIPIILVSLLASAVQTGSSPSAAFFSPLTRAWELALGALVAVVTPSLLRLNRNLAATFTWVGLAAIGYAAVAYSSSTSYPGTAVMVPVIGTALVIAGGSAVPTWGGESILRLGPFQWVGRLSYSLYLWHWPILIIAAEQAGQNGLPFHQNLKWLALSVAMAYGTYKLVENPIRHAGRLTRDSWLPIGLGVALIGISLTVATIFLALDSGPQPASTSVPNSGSGPFHLYTTQQVRQLVKAAPLITTLPSNLTPSLADVHDNWAGLCRRAGRPMPRPPFLPARLATLTARRACLGDSHAAMWFDVMELITKINHWRLVILTKETPVVDLPFRSPPGFGSPGSTFTECDRWHTFAQQRIRQIHPNLVILTQDPNLGPGNVAYNPTTWGNALTKAIRRLPVPANRVIVLGNIPQTPTSGPECLSRHQQDVQRCSSPNSPYISSISAAEQQTATSTGATYIDLVPMFCSTVCTGVIGRYQPYWDAFHITAAYSLVTGIASTSQSISPVRQAPVGPYNRPQ